ncbi:DUF484 family protein [Halioxenophilus sp. WMMB6]|uniref:DUF484 family protein n=1 Tax=Halioxenophilus sp. WMMB6 TaxID=3073815 RepID=UPI00295F1A2B|nr:DUF484 family protein [Halioxenophilus sp. WMMB6]
MSKTDNNALHAEAVRKYLIENPEFFQRHRDILQNLLLPHDTGNAVSLIEKQVSVLRERNVELRHRLTQLVENARENDILFDKTRRLVLSLMETDELGDFIDALLYSLDNDFQVQFSTLVLFDEQLEGPVGPARVYNSHSASKQFPKLWRAHKTLCGQLPREDIQQLFPKNIQSIGSVAVAPVNNGSPLGLLAIGHKDPDYYRSSMGTLFLGYIAEVLNRSLPRLINKAAGRS